VIPLRDQNPTAKTPIVNRLLIVANILVWIYVVTLTRQPSEVAGFYDRYSFDWAQFSSQITHGQLTIGTFTPLLTHMFVHGGWLHIIGNMVYLWVFGDNVEDRLGSGTYLVFYILCGIAAAIGQGIVQPEPMVGASGAIAGVLGAYVVMFPTARVSTLVFLGIFITILQLPALIVIGFFIVLQVIDALAELRLTAHQAAANVAYFAHLFGFAAGILLLLLFRQRREQGRFRFG
jgi:membrane associated rhomboid family serine protease